MLKKVGEEEIVVAKKLRDVDVDNAFTSGLEYGCPARGPFNIVHTGFLIPESHQIFVCALNCLRGVVLTAAEMGAQGRFSMITIKENNVLEGDMEKLLIDGTTSIIRKLKYKPRAVLIYISCIHHFTALDFDYCFKVLRKRFKDIRFTDCYMNPIMRKSGMTPDETMRLKLYSMLDNSNKKDNYINIFGNNYKTDGSSDLIRLIKNSKYKVRDITYCKKFDKYLDMAKSRFNITYLPVAKKGAEITSKRLSQENIYIPISYDRDTIKKELSYLAEKIGVDISKFDFKDEEAFDMLKKAKEVIGDMAIAIDYTFTPALFSLANVLLQYGFNVKKIYTDSITEKEVFVRLQKEFRDRDIYIYPTVNVAMRVNDREQDEKYLALGQKAAYYTNTNYFVNEVECGGHYGFDGIKRLAENMIDAYMHEKDTFTLIQRKGIGCDCLL